MLGLDRVGNRLSKSFLTRNFPMEIGDRAQKRKNRPTSPAKDEARASSGHQSSEPSAASRVWR